MAPEWADPHFQLAVSLHRAGRSKEALTYLRRAEELAEPNSVMAIQIDQLTGAVESAAAAAAEAEAAAERYVAEWVEPGSAGELARLARASA